MEVMTKNIYTDGQYLSSNPTWHEEDAPFKAKYISKLLIKNSITFSSIAEIGCGTGGVLRNVRKLTGRMDAEWHGYDISEEAISLAQRHRESHGIIFQQADLLGLNKTFDVLLIIDVFEHVPDYLGFITSCRQKARYKIYHIPLDLHVSAALRDSFVNARKSVGHLHYFSEKTARATLNDTGHSLIDSSLTPGALELFRLHPKLKSAFANAPRFAFGLLSSSLSVRLFGGYSLLVLTE